MASNNALSLRSKGRQKVEIKYMEKESNRLVTFSKRRAGLFKKASELCTLTGAHATIIVYSPGRKLFAFGHPTVDANINRFLYLDRNLPVPNQNDLAVDPHGDDYPTIAESNQQLAFLKDQIEKERKKIDQLNDLRKSMGEDAIKFMTPVEQLTLQELKRFEAALIVARRDAIQHQRWLIEAQSNTNPSARNPMEQAFYYQPDILGFQNLNLNQDPNPNPTSYYNPTATYLNYTPTPPYQTFGDPSQMSMMPPASGRGPDDNPSMVMIPTPRRVLEDNPSSGMNSNGIGMHLGNANYQGGPNHTEGQFNGFQTMLPNPGVNTTPGASQSFTAFQMGDGSMPTSSDLFKFQGGFGFGPGMP